MTLSIAGLGLHFSQTCRIIINAHPTRDRISCLQNKSILIFLEGAAQLSTRCNTADLDLTGAVWSLTKVGVRQFRADVVAVGDVFAGAAIDSARLGNGLDQVLIVSVSPAPPADLWLATACDHGPRGLVPACVRETVKQLASLQTAAGSYTPQQCKD